MLDRVVSDADHFQHSGNNKNDSTIITEAEKNINAHDMNLYSIKIVLFG